jgi:hypothetical protein
MIEDLIHGLPQNILDILQIDIKLHDDDVTQPIISDIPDQPESELQTLTIKGIIIAKGRGIKNPIGNTITLSHHVTSRASTVAVFLIIFLGERKRDFHTHVASRFSLTLIFFPYLDFSLVISISAIVRTPIVPIRPIEPSTRYNDSIKDFTSEFFTFPSSTK